MATFAISADRFVLPGATAQGGYLQIQDGAFGTWTAERPECEIVAYPGATVGPRSCGYAHPWLPQPRHDGP